MAKPPVNRIRKTVQLTLDDHEQKCLDELAKRNHMTRSRAVGQLVREHRSAVLKADVAAERGRS